MAFTIHDRNGNLYCDVDPVKCKATCYISLKEASEVLAKLPKGYMLKDTQTKKKVEPI